MGDSPETFYNAAFTEEQKSKILPLILNETDAQGTDLATSENNVFLLTEQMVNQYVTSSSMKIAKATEALRPNANYSRRNMIWWTSSINRNIGTKAAAISTQGSETDVVFYSICGVRPAIWVYFGE